MTVWILHVQDVSFHARNVQVISVDQTVEIIGKLFMKVLSFMALVMLKKIHWKSECCNMCQWIKNETFIDSGQAAIIFVYENSMSLD